MAIRAETVLGERVIWQSIRAKTYCCPICHRWIKSQYEGDAVPRVLCYGQVEHRLEWDDA